MGQKRATLTNQIRKAIDASGMSRYRICKMAGLSQATMSRFMSGKGGLSLDVLDRLGDCLGLDIVARDREAGNKRRGEK